MTTILTILSLMWLSWVVALLLVMRFLPQDGNILSLSQLEKRYL